MEKVDKVDMRDIADCVDVSNRSDCVDVAENTLDLRKTVSDFADRVMDENDLPGVAMGVSLGEESFCAARGLRDYTRKGQPDCAPLQESDVFHCASVSKLFTSSAIMKLVECGALNLYDRRGGTVYPMAVMDYTGPKSIAVLKDFPLSKADTLNYYVTESGEMRYPYADMSDGKCRAALTYLAAYSDSSGCADIILSLSSLYIADSFDSDSFASLKDKGIYGIYADGDRIVHTEKSVSLRDVFSSAEITYTVE